MLLPLHQGTSQTQSITVASTSARGEAHHVEMGGMYSSAHKPQNVSCLAKSIYALTGYKPVSAGDTRALKRSQSMSSHFQAVRFDAQNLDYYVGKVGKETKILSNVTCSFRPGQGNL